MDNKFSVGPRHFSLTKLNAREQFHVVRRMGPTLIESLAKLGQLQKIKATSTEKQLEQIGKVLAPVLGGLAKLSQEDADYVLDALLSCVEVQQAGGNWAKVFANGVMMVNDLEFPVMMQVASRAFMFNLSGFFPELPQ